MIEKTVFKNNLKLLSIDSDKNDSVTIMVFVKAGGRYESIEKSGLSHFVEHAVFKGTQKRPNAKEIALEIEKIGGIQNAATGHEFTYYFAKVPSAKVEIAFDVLADILFHSEFKKEFMEMEKQVILEEINVYNDLPMEKVSDYFMNLLWPNHPLGTDLTGSKKQFSALQRQDIIDYVEKYYHAGNMLVVTSGNCKISFAKRLTEKYFLKNRSGKTSSFEPASQNQTAPQFKLYFKKTDQTHFYLGVRALSLSDPRRYHLEIMTAILGKGMSSRLFESLREKNGLCYYIGAGSQPFSDTGFFYIRAGVDNQRFLKALDLSMKELKKIKTARVPKKELQKTKEQLKGRLKLSMETSDSEATFYGMQEFLLEKFSTIDEVCEKIDKVTQEDVLAIANEIFIDQNLNLAAITPFKDEEKIKNILHF